MQPKPFCHPFWKIPGKRPWFCMYKDHLWTCSQSGLIGTHCSHAVASLDPAAATPIRNGGRYRSCCTLLHFGYEELTSRSPRPGGGTSTPPTPHHQRSRDLWRAELLGAEQGMDPPEGLSLTPEVLPGPQLRLVHLAFRFWTEYLVPCPWHRVGPRWPLKTVPSPAILWLSIILLRSTDFIRETVGFCIDYTEAKRKSV